MNVRRTMCAALTEFGLPTEEPSDVGRGGSGGSGAAREAGRAACLSTRAGSGSWERARSPAFRPAALLALLALLPLLALLALLALLPLVALLARMTHPATLLKKPPLLEM